MIYRCVENFIINDFFRKEKLKKYKKLKEENPNYKISIEEAINTLDTIVITLSKISEK